VTLPKTYSRLVADLPSSFFRSQGKHQLNLRLLSESPGIWITDDEVGVHSFCAGPSIRKIPVHIAVLHDDAAADRAGGGEFVVASEDVLLGYAGQVLYGSRVGEVEFTEETETKERADETG
jgi:hypothetical protein